MTRIRTFACYAFVTCVMGLPLIGYLVRNP
jgi:hypothetical protein